jgi:predicted permease
MRWAKRWRRRLRALVHPAGVDRELDEELAFHLEMETQKNLRAGMTADEARRQARLAFGAVRQYRAEVRDARWLAWLPRLSLDFTLGVRMLVKYPGLTVVGGLAMAFAIWVGAGAFEFVGQVLDPRLPFPGGDRVVALRQWDAAAGRVQPRVLHDFVAWRATLRSVTELGAYRALERNLITGDGAAEPVEVAEISASAFRLTRVPPLLGRALVEADERPDAPPVAVIGHDVWRERFGGDRTVVGRAIRLGSVTTTVVGVMPAGYGFPVAQRLWVPLRVRPPAHAGDEGPPLDLFGRLAPGVTLDEAQAELATLGRRAAADRPATHRHLRPQVLPYARAVLDLESEATVALRSANLFFVMLLVLVCGNVALLTFARAATRETELLVRSALGASRGRIVLQLFAEALVLGALAAAVGLAAAGAGLRWMLAIVEADAGYRLPFWFHGSLSPATVVYAAALTLLGAAVAGVVPALKVTRGIGARLRETNAGGGGLRIGGIWTAVIVAQVAVTVAFPVTAYVTRRQADEFRSLRVGYAEREFLSARVDLDREPAPGGDTTRAAYLARFRDRYRELERRLAAEPGVAGVTVAERFPRMYHPARLVEVDAGGAAPLDPDYPAYRVSAAAVDADYFDVLGAPLRAGRPFHAVDLEAEARVVIVNQSFVHRVLGGRNPIGRRVRYLRQEETSPRASQDAMLGPWHVIVGVAPDLGMGRGDDPKVAGIYHPLAPTAAAPVHLAVRVRGDPRAFAPRLRPAAAAVDPALRLDQITPMAELSETSVRFLDFWFTLTALVSVVALVLSLAGIYAVMSFTVARRTREIGIRVALGASARRVVASTFRRPLLQVGAGALAGGVLAGLLLGTMQDVKTSLGGAALVVAYAAGMLGVCLLACVVPTRRALGVQPTEALRTEG